MLFSTDSGEMLQKIDDIDEATDIEKVENSSGGTNEQEPAVEDAPAAANAESDVAAAVDKMKKKEVVSKLKELGLDTKGKEHVQRQRLKEAMQNQAAATDPAADEAEPAAAPVQEEVET